jgi:hypothetical protein
MKELEKQLNFGQNTNNKKIKMRHINFLVKFVFLRNILRKLGLNPILHKFIYSNNM